MAKLAPAAKVGDTVHIKGTVITVYRTEQGFISGYNFRSIHGTENLISADEVVHIEPRPLVVGDMVRAEGYLGFWDIIAINNGVAWIKSTEYETSWLVPTDKMTRIDSNEAS